MNKLKLIVGLGNPGKKYDQTRHNIGFMAIDRFAKRQNLVFKSESKLNGVLATYNLSGNKAILLKPTTYMNLSGEAIIKAMQYYDIPLENVLIIVDDIDIPVGMIRIREMGGHGGHNGLRSITNHLKSRNFKRIRLGIDHDEQIPLDSYVLSRFNQADIIKIDLALDKTEEIVLQFILGRPFLDIMTQFNTQSK